MTGMVDFHSHVLPGIDDGSGSVEESLEMLRMEARQGIGCVVATPHCNAHREHPEAFLERRDRAADLLRSTGAGIAGLPELYLGAEVTYYRGISESAYLPQLTFGKNHCILIEMMPSPWPEDAWRELETIWTGRGIIPVIAHVDRYISPLRTYGIPQRLEKLPVLVQANAGFFLRRSTASMALRLLRAGRIQLLGSDCHDLDGRAPNLGQAMSVIRERLGGQILTQISDRSARLLFADREKV